MSRGPGRIERAIRELFDAHPDLAFVTDELAEHCYPDAGPIERKHQVAVLRAAQKVVANDPDWTVWLISGMGTGLVFVNQANVQSYTLGLMIGSSLPDIIYRSEKRARRRPGEWVRYSTPGPDGAGRIARRVHTPGTDRHAQPQGRTRDPRQSARGDLRPS